MASNIIKLKDDSSTNMSKLDKQLAEREYHVVQRRWKRLVSDITEKELEICTQEELKEDREKLETLYKDIVNANSTLEALLDTEEEREDLKVHFDFVSSQTQNMVSILINNFEILNSNPCSVDNNLNNVNHIHSITKVIASNDKSNVVNKSDHNVKSVHNNDKSDDNISIVSGACSINSKKSTLSRSSSVTSREAKAERAAKAARLKAELRFFDTLEKQKSEVKKTEMIRELVVTEAEINAIAEIEEDRPDANVELGLPTVDNMTQYLSTQAQSVSIQPEITTRRYDVSYPSNENDTKSRITEKLDSPDNPTPTNSVINTNPPANTQDLNPISQLAAVLCQHLGKEKLPVPEPSVFRGDALEYPIWSRSFSTFIEKKTSDPAELLFYLHRFTAGEANESIKPLFNLQTMEAYEKAKQTLHNRYGNSFIVSNAYKKKIHDWPHIPHNDGIALRKFSDFLQNTKTAMNSILYLNCLNDPEENQKLLKKLPTSIASRWSRIVDDSLQNENNFPTFPIFADFIEKEARIWCNPVTSLKALREETDDRKPKDRRIPSRSLSTSSTSSPPAMPIPCSLCKQSHELEHCRKFISMHMNDKSNFMKENSICHGCLREGHMKFLCKDRKICKKCNGFHPTPLHDDNFRRSERKDFKLNNPRIQSKRPNPSAVVNSVNGTLCTSHSLIVPVKIHHKDNPAHKIDTYLVIDDQSDSCFIDDSLCEDLEIDGQETNLNLSTMLGTATIKSHKIDGLVVKGMYEKEEIYLPTTFSRQQIPVNRDQIPRRTTAVEWPHLRRISHKLLPYNPHMKIGLLVGINCIKAVKPLEIIPGNDEDPYGIRTSLGWGVVGLIDKFSENHITSSHLCTTTPDGKKCHFAFRTSARETISPKHIISMFEQDFHETSLEKPLSYEDSKFLDIVNKGIHRTEDGHLEMPLPFKGSDIILPDNKARVLKRLKGLHTKLTKDKKYNEDYQKFMKKIIDSKYAEEVPASEIYLTDRVWYIPHHGIYHPNKPKISVVFDCSITYQNHCLNNLLLTGPDLTNSLISVLYRFRKDKIAFICDLEAMFFQLKVNEEHRNYLRFFWWRDGDLTKEPTMYRMTVHLFGASSSPGCANFGLKTTANMYESEFGTKTAEFIRSDFYVDDGLKSVATVEEAKELIANSQEMCARNGFRLHKFMSNNKEVLVDIPEEDLAVGTKNIDPEKNENLERALGVQWCVEDDTLRFRIKAHEKPLTRRGILSTVSSIFDPLGLVCPFILTAKRILQDLCVENNDWDRDIPETIRNRWIQWKSELPLLDHLKIRRSYKPEIFDEVERVELHHFSDASTQGYGQCSYLKLVDIKGKIQVTLLTAKARVAPTKIVTVPRLELSAAVISVRVAAILKTELGYNCIHEYFWTDSKVVLGYISNDVKRFHTYVANRVQQIRNYSSPVQWQYIDTKLNPADDASRGLHARELINGSRWWNGPDFLWETTETERLPTKRDENLRSLKEDDPEVRKIVTLTTIIKSASLLDRTKKFSDWHRLKLAISCLLRRCKAVHSNEVLHENSIWRPSNVQDLKTAEILILKELQKEYFSEELKVLKRLEKTTNQNDRSTRKEEKVALKVSNTLYKLDAFLDQNGLIRVGGRIQNAEMPSNCKHPVVIPKTNHITELIVRDFHEKCNHQSRGITHNLVRSSGFWIIGGRTVISNIINKCVTCKKLIGQTQVQKMAPLPKDRLEPAPPFTYSAVDYFGPFVVKEFRREVTRYGVLFTCMASRAIHLEVAHKMNTDSFLNAYRRFVCRRGPIRQLRSDQGSNFVGAQSELKAALNEMDDGTISRELIKVNCDYISFKMNTPDSSHMGGSWERLIRSVRSVLVALLHTHGGILDDETLRTFMTEAESIVNSRPLSIHDINDPNYPEPITPNHLLTMKSQFILPPPGVFVRHDLYLRKRWRRVQFLANEFWKRWRRDYIQSSQPRQKWQNKTSNLKVNDIVLIKDDNIVRNLWKLGRISEVFPSVDNLTRKVRIELASEIDMNGKRRTSRKYLDRPIHKLVLILSVEEPGIPAKEP